MTDFDKLDKRRLEAIKAQAQYRKHFSFKKRFDIAMNHLEGLREMKRNARRTPSEKIR